MNENLAKRLRDAFDACQTIRFITTTQTFDEFEIELLVQLATERLVGIVGEALAKAKALDSNLDAKIPELNLIIGMRHHLIHGYDRVDGAIVLDVAQNRIAVLEQQLQVILEGDEG